MSFAHASEQLLTHLFLLRQSRVPLICSTCGWITYQSWQAVYLQRQYTYKFKAVYLQRPDKRTAIVLPSYFVYVLPRSIWKQNAELDGDSWVNYILLKAVLPCPPVILTRCCAWNLIPRLCRAIQIWTILCGERGIMSPPCFPYLKCLGVASVEVTYVACFTKELNRDSPRLFWEKIAWWGSLSPCWGLELGPHVVWN